MRLYLDDIRNPKSEGFIVVRSVEDAISFVKENGIPNYISFDHDLGDNVPSGYDFAKWLVEESLDGNLNFPEDFDFNVHSANPVGAKNIQSILENYLNFKG